LNNLIEKHDSEKQELLNRTTVMDSHVDTSVDFINTTTIQSAGNSVEEHPKYRLMET
jgi:hypothetical protein